MAQLTNNIKPMSNYFYKVLKLACSGQSFLKSDLHCCKSFRADFLVRVQPHGDPIHVVHFLLVDELETAVVVTEQGAGNVKDVFGLSGGHVDGDDGGEKDAPRDARR
jgi:hypothetical protein